MPAPSGKTSQGFPYPLETDGVDPARDIKALAEYLNTWNAPWILPIGAEAEWAGANDPVGGNWMVEDGRELSRSVYGVLFAAIGTTYGAGDGSTTFNIPDTRGRVSIGSGKGSGLTNRNRGEKSGEEAHTLTTTEMPAHTHVSTGTATNGGGSFAFEPPGGWGGWLGHMTEGGGTAGTRNFGAAPGSGMVINVEGGSLPHNNMSPFIVKNKIIRVL